MTSILGKKNPGHESKKLVTVPAGNFFQDVLKRKSSKDTTKNGHIVERGPPSPSFWVSMLIFQDLFFISNFYTVRPMSNDFPSSTRCSQVVVHNRCPQRSKAVLVEVHIPWTRRAGDVVVRTRSELHWLELERSNVKVAA